MIYEPAEDSFLLQKFVKKYAKGLVEIHNSDHNAIKKEIGSMQTMLQKILELLLKK